MSALSPRGAGMPSHSPAVAARSAKPRRTLPVGLLCRIQCPGGRLPRSEPRALLFGRNAIQHRPENVVPESRTDTKVSGGKSVMVAVMPDQS